MNYEFSLIGRNVRRCWHGRSPKPFDIVAINAGLVSVKFDSILGTLDAVVQYGERWNTVDGKQLDRGFAPCGHNFGHLGGQIPGIVDWDKWYGQSVGIWDLTGAMLVLIGSAPGAFVRR